MHLITHQQLKMVSLVPPSARNAHDELEGMHQRRPFRQNELNELLEAAVKAHHCGGDDPHNTKATINLLVRWGACKDKVRNYLDMYPNKYGYIKELWAEEKPLFPTEWKPVLMFTKTELRESAAQIKGMGPQRTEKIWRMMPFSSAFHEADDWEVEYILMKLVELKGLDCKHFYMEEHKHNQALADVHLAAMLAQSQAMLAQSQAMLAHRRRAQTAQTAALILPQGV